MDGLQLEKLYVAIEAQTQGFNKAISDVNARIDGMSNTVKGATSKATKSIGGLGKALVAAFSVRALLGFFNKFLEITKQTETFKKSIATAFAPLVNVLEPIMQNIILLVARAAAVLAGFVQSFLKLPKAASKTTDAVKATAKAVKQLAGFDEINNLTEGADTAATADLGGVNLLDPKDAENLFKAGEALGNIARWLAIIVGIAAGLYIFKNIAGLFGLVSEAWAGMGVTTAMNGKAMQPWVIGIQKAFEGVGEMFTSFGAILRGGVAQDTMFAGTLFDTLQTALMGIQGVAISAGAATAIIIAGVAVLIGVFVSIGIAIADLWKNNEDFRNKVTKLWEDISGAFVKAYKDYIEPVLGFIGLMFVNVYDNFIAPFYERVKEFVIKFVDAMIEVWTAVKPVVDIIVKVLGPLVQATFLIIGAAIYALVAVFFLMMDAILFVMNVIVDLFRGAVKVIKATFFDPFVNMFNGITEFVKGTFTGNMDMALKGLGKIFDGVVRIITTPFRLAFNTVAQLWNSTIGGIDFTVPNWVPIVGGSKFSMPKLPMFANGGMPSTGSLFIANEAGPELVGSIGGRTAVMNNDQIVSAVAQGVAAAVASVMGGNEGGDVILNVDGMTLGKVAIKNINKVQRNTALKLEV